MTIRIQDINTAEDHSSEQGSMVKIKADYTGNTKGSEERCGEYDTYVKPSGSDRGIRQANPRTLAKQCRNNDKNPSTVRRYELNLHLKRIGELADAIVAAYASPDLLELSAAGHRFCDELNALWQLRGLREEEWIEVLNFLQLALQDECFEEFDEDQCTVLREITKDFLNCGLLDQEDVLRMRLELRRVGLNPWKAFTRPEEQSQHG